MDCVGEIFGVRCRKRVWVYSERVFGLFRGEETLPRKGVACSMERVRGGRIGSRGRCRKELLRGGVRRLWFPGLPAVPGGSVPDGFMCGVYRLHRDLLPVAGRSAGRVSCGGRCRLRRGLLLRMGGLRAGYSGRWPGRAGRRSPLSVPCGVGSGIDTLKQGPAGAGRQLPLYNYDSGCFIFDTMLKAVSIPFRSWM